MNTFSRFLSPVCENQHHWDMQNHTEYTWNTCLHCHLLSYVVWQKSNETDFLLTMNFILFTNQGYPLQNSSLGQLHSDGGVVSIVCSGAGRLLLVYLSACRLRTSGYYLSYQNGALSIGFWARGIKRSHRDWDPANRGAAEPQDAFCCQKFIFGDCRVTCGVVVVQHPSACNAWSHTCHRTSRQKVRLTVCPGGTNSLWTISWLSKKQMSIDLILDLLILAFLEWERLQCATPNFGVLSRGHLQNPWSITCDNATEEFWLPLKAVQKIKAHPSDWTSAQSWGSLEPSWRTLFSCPNPVLKFDER